MALQALASHPDSANFGAAAAKLKQGRGGVKPEPGRAPSHTERDRISTVEKNNFKCPRCYKVYAQPAYLPACGVNDYVCGIPFWMLFSTRAGVQIHESFACASVHAL